MALLCPPLNSRAEERLLDIDWKGNGFATARYEINGTEGRNNPLRKKLAAPFSEDEIFVRYRIRYSSESIDLPDEDEGEFFVLWLDNKEGNDQSTHSGGIPNLGIHVSEGKNKFMVRYGPGGEKFGAELVGDRDFLLVARLWKSESGKGQPFDQFDLWVNPEGGEEFKPDASVSNAKSISELHWIGFSTGAKTEIDDRIVVWDTELSRTWQGIMGLPDDGTGEGNENLSEKPKVEPTVDFQAHVYPILESKCFKCHRGEKAKKGIRLDIYDEVLNLTSPGDAAASRLFELVSHGEMPPEDEAVVTEQELDTMRKWIDEGLAWNEEILPTPVPKTDHWAFQPIERSPIPEVKNGHWVSTPVDAFIAAKQEALGVSPAEEADAKTLQRRMSLDLLGLPAGESERTVDELLDDPAYGERWGRHWLDVARWAESNGYQHNRDRPYAWRYRDWVVDAFNSNMRYDHFILAQLAGDELESPHDRDLTGTGFLAAARYSGNELDKDIQRNDILVDIVNTTGSAFLGLTLECAQCHTHKFDPITIRDYYRMQAFFAKGQPGNVSYGQSQPEHVATLVEGRWKIFDDTYQRQVSIRRKKGVPGAELVIPKSVVSSMKAEDRSRFQALDGEIEKVEQTWAYFSPQASQGRRVLMPHEMRWPLERDMDSLRGRSTHLLLRGDVKAKGPEVEPGWPRVFGGGAGDLGKRPRSALARWLTGPENPLTARVWVNRIWQWHFGRGIVGTSGDFGAQGSPPSHPLLLDYLAAELIDSGWDTRHIHRLILNSSTYRQSSRYSERNDAIDPDNTTYWRWVPRRLEAEAVRDSMLAAAGMLDRRMGGESDPLGIQSRRRSVYLKQARDKLPNQQVLFDGAGGVVSCARRRVSTTSLQPLWLMNSRFSGEVAAGLAKRAGSTEMAFALAIGRDATAGELASLQELEAKHGTESACLAILNFSEFLYIP